MPNLPAATTFAQHRAAFESFLDCVQGGGHLRPDAGIFACTFASAELCGLPR
jgi:hypothetical protein